MHYSNACESWDGIAVVEELTLAKDYQPIETSGPYKTMFKAGVIPYNKYWGKDFFIHDPENPKKNYFVHEMSQNARYAVPLLRHIANFIDSTKEEESEDK